jgi:hypothetical protein
MISITKLIDEWITEEIYLHCSAREREDGSQVVI